MNDTIYNDYAIALESGHSFALAFLERNRKEIEENGADHYLDFMMNMKIRYIEHYENEMESILFFVKQLKDRPKYFVSHSAMVYNFLSKCQFNIDKKDLFELQQYLRDRPSRFTFMHFMVFLSYNASENQINQLFRIMDDLLDSILTNIKEKEKNNFEAYFLAFKQKQFFGNRVFDIVMNRLCDKYNLGLMHHCQ